jgi:hypothetical protein
MILYFLFKTLDSFDMIPVNVYVQWSTSTADNYYFDEQKMLTVTTIFLSVRHIWLKARFWNIYKVKVSYRKNNFETRAD